MKTRQRLPAVIGLLCAITSAACAEPPPGESYGEAAGEATNEATKESLRVAVATSFAPSLQRLADAYRAKHAGSVRLVSGSTGKLYAQIVNGASFDLFFAADAARPRRLEAEGLIVPGSRITYALGQLVLWEPQAAGPPGLQDLRTGQGRLAMANPKLAPYGRAAREFLHSAGLWNVFHSRMVFGENAAQVFQYARSGNVRWAIVPLSLLRQGHEIGTASYHILPTDSYAPIEQQAVVLRTGQSGRAGDFLTWCLGAAAREQLRADGYLLPAGR